MSGIFCADLRNKFITESLAELTELSVPGVPGR
jgi:hypothetical protein